MDEHGGLRFDHTKKEATKISQEVLDYANAEIERILSIDKHKRTFNNTMMPFSQLESDLETVSNILKSDVSKELKEF